MAGVKKKQVVFLLIVVLVAFLVAAAVLLYILRNTAQTEILAPFSPTANTSGIQVSKDIDPNNPSLTYYKIRARLIEAFSFNENGNLVGKIKIEGDTSDNIFTIILPIKGNRFSFGENDPETNTINYLIKDTQVVHDNVQNGDLIELETVVSSDSVEDLDLNSLSTGVAEQGFVIVPMKLAKLEP